MQGQDTQKSNNVVSLFANRQKNEAQKAEGSDEASTESETNPKGESFEDVMTRNARNKERIEKERNAANKGVLRSYRIKH